MKTRPVVLTLLIVVALAISACGRAATPDAPPAPMAAEAASEKMMKEEASPGEDMMKDSPADDARTDKKMADDAMTDEKPADDVMMDDMPADDVMIDEKMADDAMTDEKPADDAMMDDMPADTMVELPAWFSASLTDVNSGQPFAIADFKGRVVLVETLAVWCSNCMRQQREVLALHEALGERNDFVSVGIGIDLNESADQLRNHAQRNGFDWIYAIATRDVAREISNLYGVNFLNPPSTPMLIIDRHGQAHPLPFGIKRAADLQAALDPFLSEGM